MSGKTSIPGYKCNSFTVSQSVTCQLSATHTTASSCSKQFASVLLLNLFVIVCSMLVSSCMLLLIFSPDYAVVLVLNLLCHCLQDAYQQLCATTSFCSRQFAVVLVLNLPCHSLQHASQQLGATKQFPMLLLLSHLFIICTQLEMYVQQSFIVTTFSLYAKLR